MLQRFVLTVVLLPVSFAPVIAQEEVVSPKEIRETWVGKTVVGATTKGIPIALKLQGDGAASVMVGATNHAGTWRLSENGYCATWKTIRNNEERCLTVRKSGSKMTVINPDGSVNAEISEVK